MDGKITLLREIQEFEFAAVELNLFLDTHPQDQAAHRDLHTVRDRLMAVRKRYEEIYGPLTAFGLAPANQRWMWIDGPWPWEIEYA